MAKTFEILQNFEGGINTNKDARDIGGSEYVLLRQVNIKKSGVLQTLGTQQHHSSNEPTSSASNYTAGQGLFLYFTEYNIPAEDASPGGAIDGDGRRVFVMSNDSNGQKVGFAQIKYDNSTADDLITYTLPWTVANSKPSFFYLNNALRIYDNNHGNNNPQWWSYIDRNFFPDATGTEEALDISGWCMMDQEIHSPKAYLTDGTTHVSATANLINATASNVRAVILGLQDGLGTSVGKIPSSIPVAFCNILSVISILDLNASI